MLSVFSRNINRSVGAFTKRLLSSSLPNDMLIGQVKKKQALIAEFYQGPRILNQGDKVLIYNDGPHTDTLLLPQQLGGHELILPDVALRESDSSYRKSLIPTRISFDDPRLEHAIKLYLASLGLEAVFASQVAVRGARFLLNMQPNGMFVGYPLDHVKLLLAAANNSLEIADTGEPLENIGAAWAMFGKGGASRVVDELWKQIIKNPELFKRALPMVCSFSHHTHFNIAAQHGLLSKAISFTPNIPQVAYLATNQMSAQDSQAAKWYLKDGATIVKIHRVRPLNPTARYQNRVVGRMVGGNLGVINADSGKPWFEINKGDILNIEEFNCDLHELHRKIDAAVRLAISSGAAAVTIGDIYPNKNIEGKMDFVAVEQLINEIVNLYSDQIAIYRVPGIGHGNPNIPILYGKEGYTEICSISGVLYNYPGEYRNLLKTPGKVVSTTQPQSFHDCLNRERKTAEIVR